MANEITYSSYTGAGRISAILTRLLHENLYDGVGLRGAMTFYPFPQSGSATMNITTVTRGNAMSAASNETSSGLTNAALTASQKQLTVARYGLIFQASDLFQLTGPNEALNVDYLYGVLTESLDLTLTDLLAALFPNVAGNVGTTTVNMSTSDLYDAIFYLTLNNNTATNLMGVLHAVQCNDLMQSIRSETGPAQYRMDAQSAVGLQGVRRGDGFRFSFAGVDIHQCNSVGTANGGDDRQGCIFAPGAFGYTLAPVALMDQVNPADLVVDAREVVVERNRDAVNGLTQFIANSYPGTVEMEDLRAVKVTTDA